MGIEQEPAVALLGRRQVLRGATTAACLCAGGVVLASCSGGSSASTPTEQELEGKEIAKASAIPVGGGKVFSDMKVVVTQPTEGDFKAFSAICTHRGCTVDTVADGLIQCPCHGSEYSIRDGSVKQGPAPKPLREYPVKLRGNEVVIT